MHHHHITIPLPRLNMHTTYGMCCYPSTRCPQRCYRYISIVVRLQINDNYQFNKFASNSNQPILLTNQIKPQCRQNELCIRIVQTIYTKMRQINIWCLKIRLQSNQLGKASLIFWIYRTLYSHNTSIKRSVFLFNKVRWGSCCLSCSTRICSLIKPWQRPQSLIFFVDC